MQSIHIRGLWAKQGECQEARTWKLHMSVSSTLIIAPALSNSPQ